MGLCPDFIFPPVEEGFSIRHGVQLGSIDKSKLGEDEREISQSHFDKFFSLLQPL